MSKESKESAGKDENIQTGKAPGVGDGFPLRNKDKEKEPRAPETHQGQARAPRGKSTKEEKENPTSKRLTDGSSSATTATRARKEGPLSGVP